MPTLKRFNGTDWEYVGVLAANPGPAATLAFTEITAAVLNIPTAATPVPGLSVTVTVPAGRRLRISAFILTSSTSAGYNQVMLYQDGSRLDRSYFDQPNPNYVLTHSLSVVVSPSAGTHTYQVYTQFGAGTGRTYAAASAPEWILVEDITGNTLPVKAASVPVGQLGYAVVPAQTDITVATDLATVNVVVPAGRVIKVTGVAAYVWSTVANDEAQLSIRMDGAEVQYARRVLDIANRGQEVSVLYVGSPSAGQHTFTFRGARSAGTGTLSVAAPVTNVRSYILVEDITPTPTPANTAPSSTLGYTESASLDQSVTAMEALTGLSLTVTVPAGRRLRISGQAFSRNSAAGNRSKLGIFEDGTEYGSALLNHTEAAVNETLNAFAVIAPTAGAHTYHLQGGAIDGGTSIFGGSVPAPAFIMVEDITPASVPIPVSTGLWQPQSTFPSNPSHGDLFYETDTNILWAWNGAAWKEVKGPRYYLDAYLGGSAWAIGSGAAVVTVPFSTVVEADDPSVFNGAGVYTCPIDGLYRVTSSVQISAFSQPRTLYHIYRNSSQVKRCDDKASSGGGFDTYNAHGTLDCVAGDTLTCRIQNTGAAGPTLSTGANISWVEFERIGPRPG